MVKIVIIVLLIAMVIALTIGLLQLVRAPKAHHNSNTLFKALLWRISIWIALFAFIFIAVKLQWIEPSNSAHPQKFRQEQMQRIEKNKS